MGPMGAFDAITAKVFGTLSPHMRGLGFKVQSMKSGVCVGRIEYRPELVGDPVTGVLHGGVVTSLLDTAGGAAVLSKLGKLAALATLDLRIDYLRPAPPGKRLFARVECYKTTRNVAFARGVAYDELETDPIASMAATYMLNTQRVRKGASE
jgi:uncharacterized protein (TIGR00369 family)